MCFDDFFFFHSSENDQQVWNINFTFIANERTAQIIINNCVCARTRLRATWKGLRRVCGECSALEDFVAWLKYSSSFNRSIHEVNCHNWYYFEWLGHDANLHCQYHGIHSHFIRIRLIPVCARFETESKKRKTNANTHTRTQQYHQSANKQRMVHQTKNSSRYKSLN